MREDYTWVYLFESFHDWWVLGGDNEFSDCFEVFSENEILLSLSKTFPPRTFTYKKNFRKEMPVELLR